MLRIIPCSTCDHIAICKYHEVYTEEVEILLTLQNKFENADITANCRHYRKNMPLPRSLGDLK